MSLFCFRNLVVFLAVCIYSVKGDNCGGLLESDAGEFDLPYGYSVNGDTQCVWVIQLLARTTLTFKLTRLDSSSATVSVYPEHDASETVLTPVRLTSSDVGETIQAAGQTLVVVLTRSDFSTGLSFTWDSVSAATSDTLTAVNYVDSGNGRVHWNRFGRRERLTWALNLESAQSLSLKAETVFGRCELLNPCWCSYFGLYEITNSGYLREVTRVCGRSSSFETEELYTKLLAFVYINSTLSVSATDHVDLEWSNQANGPTEGPTDGPTWEPTSGPTREPTREPTTGHTWSPTETTRDPSDPVVLECGGIIDLLYDGASIIVDYKYFTQYENNENCLWALEFVDLEYFVSTHVTLTQLSDGFELGHDGLTVLTSSRTEDPALASGVLQRGEPASFFGHMIYLGFASDGSNRGTGFRLRIDGISSVPAALSHGDSFIYSTVQGTHSHGPYVDNERTSIVVNPYKSWITFGVDYVDTEGGVDCRFDSLKIYEIRRLGDFTRKSKLCGHSESLTGVFETNFPVLAVFTSDSDTHTYGGFKISWNESYAYATTYRADPETSPGYYRDSTSD